ncbi:uncharacterized protein LOC128269913 [Anopheles cruzii]|uniref:uncharacterized protein LOC128269913 n=1 Tax=Anopheles cruzii TaxID=68878 RepID=UPI0022EC74A6|nr:uncharacterized protein LOC128269913 [Anopheles cruzii]
MERRGGAVGVLFPIVLLGAWLLIGVPRTGTEASELRVQDYSLLQVAIGEEGSVPCEEPPLPSDGKDDDYGTEPVDDSGTLKLSQLVTRSDVIFKAFAGHGNNLREAGVLNRSEGAAEAAHRQHHQPRWKASSSASSTASDFIVRLEPGTVYKGNELFKQLQLNSWKHYFIIWSNGSAEYSPQPTAARPTASASLGNVHVRTGKPTYAQPSPKQNIRSMNRSTARLNCTAARGRRRRDQSQPAPARSLPPTTTTTRTTTVGNHSSKNVLEDPATGATAGRTVEDDSVKPNDAHNLEGNRADDGSAATHRGWPSFANGRVNLPASRRTVQDATEDARTGTEAGQISRTLNEILPVTVIVFGRLVGDPGETELRVDPYMGLLRWSPRLEDALWQALGWSEWSDYTGCSVACGKGVQQRFRHCLQFPADPAAATATPGKVAHRSRNPSRGVYARERQQQPAKGYVTATAAAGVPTSSIGEHRGPSASPTRTQPVTFYHQPGASIRSTDHDASPTASGVTSKRKVKSKPKKNKPSPHGWDGKPVMDFPTTASTPLAPPGESAARQNNSLPRDDLGGASCEGHNIEQRSCNLFDCSGTVDLLTALKPDYHWRNWDASFDERINYEINQLEQNFTLMVSFRFLHPRHGHHRMQRDSTRDHRLEQRPAHSAPPAPELEPTTDSPPAAAGSNNNILSLRSKLTTGPSLSINFVTDGHGGLRVIQEKYGLSEMLPVPEAALFDGDWHSLALSGRNGGGFVTVYADCQWINSFVLAKGSIELPQYPLVEVGHDIELHQLTVVPGAKSTKLQCGSQAVAIRDVENRQVINYFEHLN